MHSYASLKVVNDIITPVCLGRSSEGICYQSLGDVDRSAFPAKMNVDRMEQELLKEKRQRNVIFWPFEFLLSQTRPRYVSFRPFLNTMTNIAQNFTI